MLRPSCACARMCRNLSVALIRPPDGKGTRAGHESVPRQPQPSKRFGQEREAAARKIHHGLRKDRQVG
eukprot:scaffold13277_cov114-Isochrysis_galbana.AAC.2